MSDASVLLLPAHAAALLPPLAVLILVLRRRPQWLGCHLVFWDAIAAWAALTLLGHAGWLLDEAVFGNAHPWFAWHTLVRLTGGMLPLIALLARPHRGLRLESATTTAIDVWIITVMLGFMLWSAVLAPAATALHQSLALEAIAIGGALVPFAAAACLFATARDVSGPWQTVYDRLAAGLALSSILLGPQLAAGVRDSASGQLLAVIGSATPFLFAIWALSAALPSERERPGYVSDAGTALAPASWLFGTLVAVPVVGYGIRYLQPLGEPTDRNRELATALALIAGLGFTMLRIIVERRALGRAVRRLGVLAAAFEQTEEMVVISREDSIRYANDAFCRGTGYTSAEIETLLPSAIMAPESQHELPSILAALKVGDVVRRTLTIARKDGTQFQASYASAPIVERTGRVTHCVAVVRDITDDLALREQLVRSERMSAVGEIVAGVVHELNDPLQQTLAALGRVLDDAAAGQIRGELERAHGETVRIDAIVQNLRAFVRSTPTPRMVVEPNELVASAVALRSYELAAAAIEVRERYARDMPLVYVNREEIQQVLLNLLINAQHSMSSGKGSGVLTIQTSASGADAVIDVIDDGPGIPAWAEGRIFEPFFRTKEGGGDGPGLGLSTALGIATAHGGTLDLVRTVHGACFRLTLPGAGFPGPAQAVPLQ